MWRTFDIFSRTLEHSLFRHFIIVRDPGTTVVGRSPFTNSVNLVQRHDLDVFFPTSDDNARVEKPQLPLRPWGGQCTCWHMAVETGEMITDECIAAIDRMGEGGFHLASAVECQENPKVVFDKRSLFLTLNGKR